MFNFRIISCADGTDIIDTSLKTPYESLTPIEMMEYTEMENRLEYLDRMKRNAREEAERKRKVSGNLLYRVVCMFR